MKFYRNVYNIIGCVVLLVGIALTPFLPFIVKDMPDINGIYFIYDLFVIHSALTYFFVYKKFLIDSDQKGYITAKITFISSLLLNITRVILLVLTKNFIIYLLCSIIFVLIQNIWISNKADEMYPFIKEKTDDVISKEDKKRLLDAIYSSYPKKDVDMNVIGDVIARQINGWSYPIKSNRDVIRYSEISNLYPSLELFHKNIMTTYNDTAGCYDDMGYNGPTHTEIRIDYNSLDEENKIYADLLVKKGIAKVIDEGSGKKGISIFVPCRRDEYVREVSNRMFGVLVGFKKQVMIYGRISNQEVLNYLNGYLRYFDSEVKANINEILSTGINGANLERVNRLLQLGFYYDKGEDQFWLDEYYYRRHTEFVNSQRVIDTNAKLEKKIPQE
jgi:hypothetical protein